MVKNKFIIVTLVAFMTLSKVVSYPAVMDNTAKKEEKQDSLFGLPFLEFKNGGVRVNFGGYHAEAGLGSLLGDSKSGGGLYAGAGTPFGAHASADLGGLLNGETNSNGGFLNARAGLGNGGPGASAGLGGNLDGSDSSKSGGQLYTATSYGGNTKIKIKEVTPDQSNIQLISSQKNPQQNLSPNPVGNTDVNYNNGKNSQVRRDIALNNEKVNIIESPLPAPIASDVPVYAYSTRRCRRKNRICTLQNSVIQQQLPIAQAPVNFAIDDKIITTHELGPKPIALKNYAHLDEHTANTRYKDVAIVPGPVPAYGAIRPRGTLFDDIFNIPISALVAVNQLLNNKSG